MTTNQPITDEERAKAIGVSLHDLAILDRTNGWGYDPDEIWEPIHGEECLRRSAEEHERNMGRAL